MSYLTSKAMQTTAIGTVANSLPENKVILITLLNSSRYIPYTDLLKISGISAKMQQINKVGFEVRSIRIVLSSRTRT